MSTTFTSVLIPCLTSLAAEIIKFISERNKTGKKKGKRKSKKQKWFFVR